jgi:predicted nucleic acid-binding protein
MIVLDTNVLSEALRPAPAQAVMDWLAAQDQMAVFTTTVTQAEVLDGVESLPAGKRRSHLHSAVENLFRDVFQGRILSFDENSARVFPKVVAHRKRMGRPVSQFDAMIASICRSYGAAVATRNVADFEHCGVPIVNPWNSPSPRT